MQIFNRIKSLFIVVFLVTFSCFNSQESYSSNIKNELIKMIHYQTSFGNCPSRSLGSLTLDLVNEFKKKHSLLDLKKKIINENLEKKHFLSGYQIQYDLVSDLLKFSFECPIPLMRVQIYKDMSQESYNAILADNGEFYDPTYEILLRNEKKFKLQLSYLALPEKMEDKNVRYRIASLVKSVIPSFRSKISEMILGEDQKLTILLSLEGVPSSIFFGENDWEEKMKKLQKIVRYMEDKKKIPSIINLTNSKKVVVKFSDNF